MRKPLAIKTLTMVTCAAAMLTLSSIARAQDPAAGAATGAAVGAGVGFVVGGPVGAAVGAGVGGTVGAGAADDANRQRGQERVVVEPGTAVRERNCSTNAAGTTVCEEVRR